MMEVAHGKRRRMSAEARKAAGERLAKAREERAKKNPPKLSHIHPDVLAKVMITHYAIKM